MSLNDPLANALSQIDMADKKGQTMVIIKPSSKIIKAVLNLLKENKYLGEYKEKEDRRGNYLEVTLIGSINKTGAIKPRYSVKVKDYEKFENRYLPAHSFGFLIVSTNKGIMTHEEAIEKKLGGKLIAYVY